MTNANIPTASESAASPGEFPGLTVAQQMDVLGYVQALDQSPHDAEYNYASALQAADARFAVDPASDPQMGKVAVTAARLGSLAGKPGFGTSRAPSLVEFMKTDDMGLDQHGANTLWGMLNVYADGPRDHVAIMGRLRNGLAILEQREPGTEQPDAATVGRGRMALVMAAFTVTQDPDTRKQIVEEYLAEQPPRS